MKKIVVLFLLCLSLPAVSACDAESVSASSSVDVSVDIMAIRTHADKLVKFIDEFMALIEDFEARPRTDSPELCKKMELLYHEFKAETPPGELVPAQEHVLQGARAYLDGAWDWAVSEVKTESEVRKQLREVFLKLKDSAE